jgi:hypothetical protein
MKARRVIVLHRASAQGICAFSEEAAKRLRPSDYTNLIPITSPFFQATLQAMSGRISVETAA